MAITGRAEKNDGEQNLSKLTHIREPEMSTLRQPNQQHCPATRLSRNQLDLWPGWDCSQVQDDFFFFGGFVFDAPPSWPVTLANTLSNASAAVISFFPLLPRYLCSVLQVRQSTLAGWSSSKATTE